MTDSPELARADVDHPPVAQPEPRTAPSDEELAGPPDPALPDPALPEPVAELPEPSPSEGAPPAGMPAARGEAELALEALRAALDHSREVHQQQRRLLEKLDEENERLRSAEQQRARDPLVRDLVALADTCLRNGRAWRDRPSVTPQDVERVLANVADDVRLILERQGVERFAPTVDGTFERREARCVRSVDTADPACDGRVAEVLKPGYRAGDRVLQYAEVVVHRFVPRADSSPTVGTGSAEPV